MGATTRDGLVTRYCTVVPDTHSPSAEVRHYQPECTGRDVEVAEDGNDDIMVYSIKSFTKIDQASQDSSRVSGWAIKFFVDEVE